MSIDTVFIQFSGFLLQVLPIALLCLVPFSDDALRLPRWKAAALLGGFMLVFSSGYALLSWFIYLPDGTHDNLLNTASNLYMLACILLWILIFFLLVRFSNIGKMVVLVLLIYYAAVLFFLENIFLEIYYKRQGSTRAATMYSRPSLGIVFLLLIVTLPTFLVFLKHEIRFDLSYMENRMLKRNCIYLVFGMLLFFVCAFSLSTFEYNYDFSDSSIVLFLVAFILTDSILCYILFTEVRLTIQNSRLENQLRSFNEQYHQISENIAKARRDRHDIRHHLNMISTMNHRGEQKELEEYLRAYDASFLELEQMPLCGYPVFDNILQYYIEDAQKYGIKTEAELQTLKEILDFDVIDLTVMLGNLMENAIEACCKLPADAPRFIRIWAKQADVSFLLKIENSCEASGHDRPEFSDGACFLSTKHKMGHGQGLKSIRIVAEKYGGSAEFKKTGGVFTARVVMNIP